MNENEKVREISIMELLSALAKKWKLLLCLTLAALIIGSGIGATLAIMGNQSYGATAEFYINSDGLNRYILSLIKSDSFAEAILMDENGLPAEFKGSDIYNQALEAKKTVKELAEQIEQAEKDLTLFEIPITNLSKASSEAQSAYNEIYNHLSIMYASTSAEKYTQQIETYEAALLIAKENKDKAKQEYNDELLKKQDAEQAITELKNALEEATEAQKDALKSIMTKYRGISENAVKIQKIKDSVAYSYEEAENNDKQALLLVNIAVPKDEEFAKYLLENISTALPTFVVEMVPGEDTACDYISTFRVVSKLQTTSPVSNAIKYGGILAAVTLFGTCCVVVVVNVFKASKKEN